MRKILNSLFFILISSSLIAQVPPPAPIEESTEKILHLINRAAYGPRLDSIESVRKVGIKEWIKDQIHTEPKTLPDSILKKFEEFPTLYESPLDLYVKYWPPKKDSIGYMNVLLNASQARLIRAIESPWQLNESMIDFWYNHFNVASQKGMDHIWVGVYERQAIRPHALGKFYDLLMSTAKHPAMLYYLDNWQNRYKHADPKYRSEAKEPGVNENYAREVMELHTLGVDGGYTQADVTALSHILTGWTFTTKANVPTVPPITFYFDKSVHDITPQVFLGKNYPNQGIEDGEEALKVLAFHPSTAKHIGFKIAQYFVEDNPNPEIVNALAKTFMETGGDIKAILQTLFDSTYFWEQSVWGQKYKTPYQYVVSCIRAANLNPENLKPIVNNLKTQGMPIYGCFPPNGYKNTKEAWLSSDSVMSRINFATAFVNGGFGLFPKNKDESKLQTVVDPANILKSFGNTFSENTMQSIHDKPKNMQAIYLLVSPEMMRR